MTQHTSSARRGGERAFAIPIPTPHLDGMPEVARELARTTARVQGEFLDLWSRRAGAWLELPGEIAECGTADEMVARQMRFLRAMQRDYADYAEGVLRATLSAAEEARDDAAADAGKARKPQAAREPAPQRQAA